MFLTPFRAAALGLTGVAMVTLAIRLSPALARLIDRSGDPEGLQERCRVYTLTLLSGAILLVLSSEALR